MHTFLKNRYARAPYNIYIRMNNVYATNGCSIYRGQKQKMQHIVTYTQKCACYITFSRAYNHYEYIDTHETKHLISSYGMIRSVNKTFHVMYVYSCILTQKNEKNIFHKCKCIYTTSIYIYISHRNV